MEARAGVEKGVEARVEADWVAGRAEEAMAAEATAVAVTAAAERAAGSVVEATA